MQIVAQSDVVVRTLFVFLVMMLFANGYLFLIKAVGLSGCVRRSRRFLGGLGQIDSWQRLQARVREQPALEPFARVTRRITGGDDPFGANAAGRRRGGHRASGAMVQHQIALEAAEQAVDLQCGLKILFVTGWLAPLVGLLAAAWCTGGEWLGPEEADWAAGGVLLQLGLITAAFAWLAYAGLSLVNRWYLAQFASLEHALLVILEQGRRPDSGGAHQPSRPFGEGLPRAAGL